MPEQAGTTPPGQLRGGGLVVSQKCNKMGYSGLPWPSAHTFDLPPHRGQTWATWRQAAGDTRQEAPPGWVCLRLKNQPGCGDNASTVKAEINDVIQDWGGFPPPEGPTCRGQFW